MQKRPPSWYAQRQREKAKATPSEESYFQRVWKKIEDKGIGLIATLIISAVLFIVAVILSLGNMGKTINFLSNVDEQITTIHYPQLEGQVLNLDSIPQASLTVAIKGHDVSTTKTNTEGYFKLRVPLPVELNEITIRFLNEKNELIYEALMAVDQNNVPSDKIMRFVLPEQLTGLDS